MEVAVQIDCRKSSWLFAVYVHDMSAVLKGTIQILFISPTHTHTQLTEKICKPKFLISHQEFQMAHNVNNTFPAFTLHYLISGTGMGSGLEG